MWIFAPIVAWPLIEIALFVTLGGWIGLWATLAIVLGTAMGGMALIRQQGQSAMANLQRDMAALRNPAGPVADRALLLLAGVLLILPGFLTDGLGLLLLIPPLRHAVIAAAARRIRVQTGKFQAGGFQAGQNRTGVDIIDGEYFESAPDADTHPENRLPPSGWTRH